MFQVGWGGGFGVTYSADAEYCSFSAVPVGICVFQCKWNISAEQKQEALVKRFKCYYGHLCNF